MDEIIRTFRDLGSQRMTAEEVANKLQKAQCEQTYQEPSYKFETTEPKYREFKSDQPESELRAHSPYGPMPGRARGAAVGPRTQTDRERAKRFGFTPMNILVLTDGSEHSRKAMQAALHFRRRNDNIYVVNAVTLCGPDDQPEFRTANIKLKSKGTQILKEVQQEFEDRQMGRWEIDVVPSSDPKRAVLDYVKKTNIDMVFIGTRGIDSKTNDFFPGSFSRHMIEHSPCSVMLIR